MEEISIQALRDRLNELRQMPQPELKHLTAMWQIQKMIEERQRKLKK